MVKQRKVEYKNEAFLEVGKYLCLCHVPIGIFTLYLRFVKLRKENKSELFVLWLISDHFTIPISRMASKDQRHK